MTVWMGYMNCTDDPYAGAQKILEEAGEQFQKACLDVQQQIRAAIGEYDKQYALMRESLSQATRAVFGEAQVVNQTGEAVSGFKTRRPVTKKKRPAPSRKKPARGR
jgi:hypothetical protein